MVLLIVFTGILALIVFGAVALRFFIGLRQLNVTAENHSPVPAADRYAPMLRLLAADDAELLGENKVLAKRFRAQRSRLFRSYLRCLTKDYGRLLAGVRLLMVQSAIERPDLARALALNRLRFAMALCRIEFRLQLHSAGLATVDVSGLVVAMDVLRTQVSFMTPSTFAAR